MEDVVDVVVPDHHARLMDRLNQMRRTGRYCDVHFRVGTAVFPAHRVVLTAQADVFRNIFNIDIVEHEEEEIRMDNVDINVLQRALDFVYMGRNSISKIPAA